MHYTGPLCRLCRREGVKLFLKGARCNTQKCAIVRKNYVPGKYGKDQMGKKTEYHTQLRAKQKAKRIYGIQESQFVAYYKKANSIAGKTGENFQTLLELRFDNAVFRSGLGESRNQARQIVNHGLLRRNGRRANIVSMQVKVGDKFEVTDRLKASPLFAAFAKQKDGSPSWIKVDNANLSFEIVGMPETTESEQIDMQTIVEFYSR